MCQWHQGGAVAAGEHAARHACAPSGMAPSSACGRPPGAHRGRRQRGCQCHRDVCAPPCPSRWATCTRAAGGPAGCPRGAQRRLLGRRRAEPGRRAGRHPQAAAHAHNAPGCAPAGGRRPPAGPHGARVLRQPGRAAHCPQPAARGGRPRAVPHAAAARQRGECGRGGRRDGGSGPRVAGAARWRAREGGGRGDDAPPGGRRAAGRRRRGGGLGGGGGGLLAGAAADAALAGPA
mmetsp:Transcript_14069/g.35475  ORF Transcript_14069/g.35475 Transcript_14069/m.35475 type:complete len:234 (+) Transcript_14069:841-1542(+)